MQAPDRETLHLGRKSGNRDECRFSINILRKMTSVEALRTQIDNLQWEVNWLDAENRNLRSHDEGESKIVDLEAELEQAKVAVAGLSE